ncbi:hypothetical protein EMPS_07179 [Entomortierella parvispora]|uniref:F-box domain-containing protein n=1 Tax=Entomortierella parvispora TaxID=205924 RepID=A0A9P3HDY2_9FUNG|nr:hypothetical protein EMPS_07179 [Entomortierella parvispora]
MALTVLQGVVGKKIVKTTATTPSPPSPPSPVDIPEIVMNIFSFLDQHTLLNSAVYVCTLWFCIIRPPLQGHLRLRGLDPQVWKSFPRQLPHATALTVDLKLGPWEHLATGTGAKLWNKMALPMVCGSLRTCSYERLQELSMDMPLGSKSVPLELILTQCGRLMSLSLSCHQGTLQDHRNRFLLAQQPPTVESLRRNHHLEGPLALRLLFLNGVRLSPKAFSSYLPYLENLTDLSLVNIRDSLHPQALASAAMRSMATALLHNHQEGSVRGVQDALFWRLVSCRCPELKQISFSCHDKMTTGGWQHATMVPVELFSSVTAWGINYSCVQASNPIWRALTRRAIGNHLTSLEILPGSSTAGSQGPHWDRGRDVLLWELLCQSPSLEHFKAGHIPMSTEVLWGNRAHAGDGTFRATAASVWSCRRLKTLTLNLNSGSEDLTLAENDIMTRRIFGYLGRVCPQLDDLTLVVPCRLYAMESGLCLLTRLKDLRRLAIYTSIQDSYTFSDRPQKQDFVWMQGIAYHRGRVMDYRLQSAGPVQAGRRRRHESAYEGYIQCADKVRTWSTTVPDAGSYAPGTPSQVEERRRKMHRQQVRHRFLSSFDNLENPEEPDNLDDADDAEDAEDAEDLEDPVAPANPENPVSPVALSKVDGLMDMEFCGSFLDMEALFSARLHLLQKHTESDGDTLGLWKYAASGPDGAQPWPQLERVLLSNGSLQKESLESARVQADLVQEAMSAMRPDVKIICQYSECPHLLLDI